MNNYSISTTAGRVAVRDCGRGDPVLFIHGNSCCKEIFSPQFESELSKKYRFIAIDLPGHGKSDKAADPEKTYNFEGYADVVIEVIEKLQLSRLIIVGWSLGGHVGLSLLNKTKKIAGLLITGTPPINVSPEGFKEGFLPLPCIEKLYDKIEFSEKEAAEFLSPSGFDLESYPFIKEAAMKTDGYARYYLARSFSKGIGGNQKALVETNETPLCIIQGENDKGVNNPYIIEKVKYKNLFNKVYLVKNASHAVSWEKPQEFNQILESFLSKNFSSANIKTVT